MSYKPPNKTLSEEVLTGYHEEQHDQNSHSKTWTLANQTFDQTIVFQAITIGLSAFV